MYMHFSYENIFETVIYKIGQYGPIILIILSFFFLWNYENLFFYYTIGVFINSILNIIIKGFLQQPRPSEDPKEFELALKNGKRFIFKDGMIPHDIFGMPSGHTQSALFSSFYIFLSLRKINILLFYLIISLIVIYQRIKYNYHTFFQTLVGAIIGILFSYYIYWLSMCKIQGKLSEKQDDFAKV